MNKFLLLRLSKLELTKTLMHELRYDYVKPKYSQKEKSCYRDTDSVIVQIKTNNIYRDIAEDVETRFDTSNYELDKPFPKGKNKKVIRLMKDELGGNIMTKFVGLGANTFSYLINDNSEDKKVKGTKKCVIKTVQKQPNLIIK